MSKKFMVRQGDVLIVSAPEGTVAAEQIARDNGRIVLAYGEVTGHAHAIAARTAKLYQPSDAAALAMGARVLKVTRPVSLKHEEHGAIRIPVGDYLIVRQVEYSPRELRNVAD